MLFLLDKYKGAAEGANGCKSPMLDIEELISMGKKDRVCSYYYSREQVEEADLILLPYNYLLDPSIRSTVKINWSNTIVIIDEAHNLGLNLFFIFYIYIFYFHAFCGF